MSSFWLKRTVTDHQSPIPDPYSPLISQQMLKQIDMDVKKNQRKSKQSKAKQKKKQGRPKKKSEESKKQI